MILGHGGNSVPDIPMAVRPRTKRLRHSSTSKIEIQPWDEEFPLIKLRRKLLTFPMMVGLDFLLRDPSQR